MSIKMEFWPAHACILIDKRNAIKAWCKFNGIISHFTVKDKSVSTLTEFGSSNLDAMFLHFQSSKHWCAPSLRTSSTARLSPMDILNVHSTGHHICRVSSHQPSYSFFMFSCLRVWCMWKQPVTKSTGIGFYCWYMLNSIHTKTLNASTSICFEPVTHTM